FPQCAGKSGSPMVAAGIIGVQLVGLLEFLVGARPIPLEIALHHAQRGVSLGLRGINLQRLVGGGARLGKAIVGRKSAVISQNVVAVGHAGVAGSVGGIPIN